MSLPPDYTEVLQALNAEIIDKKPSDILQFCADFFQSRLQQRRRATSADPTTGPTDSVDPSHAVTASPGANTSTFKSVFSNEPIDSPHHPASGAPAADSNNLFSASFGGASRSAAAATGGRLGGNFPSNFNANRRTSVSAESLNPTALSGASSLNSTPTRTLTQAQFERLYASVGENFLFKNLDEDSLRLVLSALQEKSFPAGATVIKQGDEGDFFYIVESGKLQYSVNGNVVGEPAVPGSSFGELALMYNAPRAATVTALEDSVLWALDRMTFRRILMDKTSKTRKLYGDVLKEVPILSVLDSYQLAKLADAMSSEVFNPGDVVIREGDTGEKFYIIESGEADVTKAQEGKVQELGKGGYFGEVALLNDSPRKATVTAKTKLRVVTLDKRGFQRLLGPAVDILKKQDPTQK